MLVDGAYALGTSGTPFAIPTLPNSSAPVNGTFALANGQAGTYSFALGTNANQGFYVATLAFALLPGPHTIGVVLEDSSTNHNFVLSEGQIAVNLIAGSNTQPNLILEGVMDSGFLCDAACDGQVGTQLADGSWNVVAIPTDEGGYAIVPQVDSHNAVVPFDNGSSYYIKEFDANNIVAIAGCSTFQCTPAVTGTSTSSIGPFTSPGSWRYTNQVVSNVFVAGTDINIKCLKLGSTSVGMVTSPSSPSTGGVTGFSYVGDYPGPNQTLGQVPAAPSFGNVLTVNCSADLTLTLG